MREILGVVGLGVGLVVVPGPGAVAADGDWREVGLPFLWPRNGLNRVDATGPGDVWVGGYQGSLPIFAPALGTFVWTAGNPVVRRWNGTRWVEYPLRSFPSGGQVDAVEADGNEVWIAGHAVGAGTYLARFDESAFTRVAVPSELGDRDFTVDVNAAGVWARSRGTGGGAGYGLFRWTGSGWQQQTLPAGVNHLSAITAAEPGRAWAVGAKERTGQSFGTVYGSWRWDGTTWTEGPAVPTGAETYQSFDRAVAVGPDDLWALTSSATEPIKHWTGAAWESLAKPGDLYDLRDLLTGGDGSVWLTGFPAAETAVLRWNGTGWARVPGGTPAGLRDLRFTDTAVLPGSGVFWATGEADDNRRPVVITNG
ncbi:hypothetical protein [Actinocorallia lasiicapitis]